MSIDLTAKKPPMDGAFSMADVNLDVLVRLYGDSHDKGRLSATIPPAPIEVPRFYAAPDGRTADVASMKPLGIAAALIMLGGISLLDRRTA